jgi:hypothetical protein
MGGAGFTLANNLKGQKMQAHQLEHDMASNNMATCQACIFVGHFLVSTKGLCHRCHLTFKKILNAKEELRKFIYFTMQK